MSYLDLENLDLLMGIKSGFGCEKGDMCENLDCPYNTNQIEVTTGIINEEFMYE